jgi:TRAP-type C4-dicarboxylate transport system permease small subunit
MNQIAAVLKSIEQVLTRINMVIAVVCGVVWILFMLMVVGDVTGRYVFLAPIAGTMEVGQNVLAFAVFLSWAAVLARNQHIRVLILVDRMSPRWRYAFDVLALVMGFAVILPIALYGFSFATESLRLKETGITYGIPLYPGKLALFVGAILFALQFFIQLLIRLFSIRSDQSPKIEETSPTADV